MSLAVVPRPAPTETGLVGRLIADRYRVLEVIGRGGMGIVFSATDEHGGPDVVIKFLAAEWTGDPDAAARFEREAKRLSALQHPNIVRMRDYGHDEGRAYLVLEFVRGQPLTQRLRTATRLSLSEFVPIAAQILKGVGHAHSRGVVLRDIKASNVMVCDRKGRSDFVVLLDFGLAKRLEGETPITREHVMGTAGYIAPEALSGGAAGLASDVYALGVLFWTMLRGAPPFEAADEAAVLYKTVHEPVPDLQQALGPDAEVPERLAKLIERCLSKSPDDRPKDANAIVEALIDAVPSRMFRLPRVPGVTPTHRGEGNTGMIALTGLNPSGKHTIVPPRPKTQPKNRRGLWLGLAALSFAAGAVTFLPSSSESPETVAPNAPAEVQQAAVSSEDPVRDGGESPADAPPLQEVAPAAVEDQAPAESQAADRQRVRPRKRSGSRRSARGGASARPRTPAPTSPPEVTPPDEPVAAAQPIEAPKDPTSGSGPSKRPALLEKAEDVPRAPIASASVDKPSGGDVFMRADDSPKHAAPALMKPD